MSETADFEISSSPVESRKASSTSRVDSPRAYISLTSDSSTSLLPSRKLVKLDRNGSLAPRTWHGDVDEPLRGAQPASFVAIARPNLLLGAAVVAATAAHEVTLLGLEQLLHNEPGHRVNERGNDVHLAVGLPSVDLPSSEMKLRPLRVYRKPRTSPAAFV
jgi:hypothetical protein